MVNFRESLLAVLISLSAIHHVAAEELVIDFDSAVIGKPTPQWTEKGLVFELAHAPTKSKAAGRIMFFPHLGSNRKGILNAMANEAIPLRVRFPQPISKVTLVLWGSTTSSALVEAFDVDGKLVAKDGLDHVPVRNRPEEQVPFFDLVVSAKRIAYLHISGSQAGGFLAVAELRCSDVDNESLNTDRFVP